MTISFSILYTTLIYQCFPIIIIFFTNSFSLIVHIKRINKFSFISFLAIFIFCHPFTTKCLYHLRLYSFFPSTHSTDFIIDVDIRQSIVFSIFINLTNANCITISIYFFPKVLLSFHSNELVSIDIIPFIYDISIVIRFYTFAITKSILKTTLIPNMIRLIINFTITTRTYFSSFMPFTDSRHIIIFVKIANTFISTFIVFLTYTFQMISFIIF